MYESASGKCTRDSCSKSAMQDAAKKRLEERKKKYASLPEEERGKAAACKIMKCDTIFSILYFLYDAFRESMKPAFPNVEGFSEEFKNLNKEVMKRACIKGSSISPIAGAEFWTVAKVNKIRIAQERIAEKVGVSYISMRKAFNDYVLKTPYWESFLRKSEGLEINIAEIDHTERDLGMLLKQRETTMKEWHAARWCLSWSDLTWEEKEKENHLIKEKEKEIKEIEKKIKESRKKLKSLRAGEFYSEI